MMDKTNLKKWLLTISIFILSFAFATSAFASIPADISTESSNKDVYIVCAEKAGVIYKDKEQTQKAYSYQKNDSMVMLPDESDAKIATVWIDGLDDGYTEISNLKHDANNNLRKRVHIVNMVKGEQGVLGAKKLFLQGADDYAVELGASGSGNITRLQNVLNSLDSQLVTIKSDIEKTKNDYQEALSEQTKPFAQETELIEKVALLDQVNTELGVKEWSFEIGEESDEEESDETQAYDYEPIEQDEDSVLE